MEHQIEFRVTLTHPQGFEPEDRGKLTRVLVGVLSGMHPQASCSIDFPVQESAGRQRDQRLGAAVRDLLRVMGDPG